MKRTNIRVCVGKKNGYDVYRVVYTIDGHYFVKWNNKTVNVDDDIKSHRYTYC